MRTLTDLSGEYVTFDQNGAKMRRTGKIDRFSGSTVLIGQFGELGMVSLA